MTPRQSVPAVLTVLTTLPLLRASFPGSYFFESFSPDWPERWQYTSVKKYTGRFDTVQPEGFQDTATQIPAANQHYGVSATLKAPLHAKDGLVVQYEVKFTKGHTCGGAYLKLLSQTENGYTPKRLKSKTPYSIMFGPDRCGPDSRVRCAMPMD
eukprot:GHRR01033972.1.p1 GENE.GHRR01033972.1~~GHRR01033972.1.p1  ORF type:complete len:154 (+),score=13.61 GHRR01033972.1:3-464(+)